MPKHIEAAINAFEHGLNDEQLKDPAYRMTYGFIPMAAKKPGAADAAVQIISPGSEVADEIEKIIFKEVNRERYPPGKVVERAQSAGFSELRMHDHTQLWKQPDAKSIGKGFGCIGDYGHWVWFDRWIDKVLDHCENEGERYRKSSYVRRGT